MITVNYQAPPRVGASLVARVLCLAILVPDTKRVQLYSK